MLCVVVQKTLYRLQRRKKLIRRIRDRWRIVNIVYVNDSIDVFLNDFELNDAYVEKNVFDRLIVDIQFDVNVKAYFYIAFFFIRQMKVDDERIVRRENACVASKFLNHQNVVISYFWVREHENHDVVFVVSNVIL